MIALLVTKLVAVHLLARGPGAKIATRGPARARTEAGVTLVVAIEADVDGKHRVFAGGPDDAKSVAVDWGKGARDAERWTGTGPLGSIAIEWLKLEPTAGVFDNDEGGFHYEPVTYAETPWPEDAAALFRAADVSPTLLPTHGNLGTMHFQARVTLGEVTLSTPGLESRLAGGLGEDVLRVSLRQDDTFLGYLTENFNEPYIWASEGKGAMHETDRNVGGDCADFICYGLRRAGKKLEYGSTFDVPHWGGGKPIARIVSRAPDGRFLDADGTPIPIGDGGVKPGDLLLFHRHVGAFVEDRAPIGVLDANDVLVHTAWAPPDEQSFDDSARWTSAPFEVYRVALPATNLGNR